MTCDKFMRRFLEIDAGDAIPVSLRFHMFFCQKCKKEAIHLLYHFDELHSDAPYNMPVNLTNTIMKNIYLSNARYKHTVSSTKWVFSGSLILSSMFLLSFSNSFIWLKQQFGGHLEIPMSIVMGIVMSVYAVLFIGSHLEGMKDSVDSLLSKLNLL